jgi:hypothetical protein
MVQMIYIFLIWTCWSLNRLNISWCLLFDEKYPLGVTNSLRTGRHGPCSSMIYLLLSGGDSIAVQLPGGSSHGPFLLTPQSLDAYRSRGTLHFWYLLFDDRYTSQYIPSSHPNRKKRIYIYIYLFIHSFIHSFIYLLIYVYNIPTVG